MSIPSSFSQIDTTYIGKFKHEFSVEIYLAKKYTSLRYDGKDITENYLPNTPINIGIGLSWKGFGLSISHGFNFLRDTKRGKTRALDLQYHYYGRKLVLDFFGQNYKGLYLENGNEGKSLEIFPDVQLVQIGVFGQYVFNGNKFSYRAAFDQSERQLKSAGSLLVGGGVYYNRILINDETDTKRSSYQFGPNVGYAYNQVIRKDFYVSGSLSFGVNGGVDENSSKLNYYPNVFGRFSTGYNAESWSVNFSYVDNRLYIMYIESDPVSMSTGKFQLIFVKRFDSKSKILKRLSRLTS
ncbi:DUF4421 domain-containing protein [Flavobacterium sp. '19STA2R22 D10 B1']|uniref:DUF4421 domain-containing protein n=1 Tax=Flavobacterium aerium TaxID=3037261 RepID=UPI00278BBF4B|nr:DUF4421 domain-containing protein [Flavobacterium sp. '19STA2R22 D10 B1']